jgi:hypothetical protein
MPSFLNPTPSPEGIAKLQELLRRKYKKEVSDQEAGEALRRLMVFLYNMNNPNPGAVVEVIHPTAVRLRGVITMEENARRYRRNRKYGIKSITV